MSVNYKNIPLVYDLDGTLFVGDITLELCIEHIKNRKILGIFQIIRWLFRGKSHLKNKLDIKYYKKFNVENLLFNKSILDLEEFSSREKYLVSGSPDLIVKKISNHLNCFKESKGTNDNLNLTGKNKLNYLKNKFPEGFDYIGNSYDDIEIWKYSNNSYTVNISSKTEKALLKKGLQYKTLIKRKNVIRSLIKSLRLHQWFKNILVFAIPFMNLNIFAYEWLQTLFFIFISFGLIASSTYLLNDILDIKSDRQHKTKKYRPIASGLVTIPSAFLMSFLLFTIGMLLAYFLSAKLLLMLMGYTCLSIIYSTYLKQLAILDVMTLSTLFCWRVITGGYVLGLEANIWFILSIGFIFLSLAFGKRYIELLKNSNNNSISNNHIPGRGYRAKDANFVITGGVSSGFTSLVIILIYLMLPLSKVITSELAVISIIFLITFWFLRFWFLIGREEVNDDPIIFALKDLQSRFILFLVIFILFAEQIIFNI